MHLFSSIFPPDSEEVKRLRMASYEGESLPEMEEIDIKKLEDLLNDRETVMQIPSRNVLYKERTFRKKENARRKKINMKRGLMK